MVELIEVTKDYGAAGESTRLSVLKGISLKVEVGRSLVIVGPSGCGKTTLLRLISLLDKPTSGTIRFNGREITTSARVNLDLRRKIAIVFQRPALFNTSVFNNVAYGLKIRKEGKSNWLE